MYRSVLFIRNFLLAVFIVSGLSFPQFVKGQQSGNLGSAAKSSTTRSAAKSRVGKAAPAPANYVAMKKAVPVILDSIYRNLDQGQLSVVAASMSPELANNTQKLDRLCKPFAFRAFTVERMIERPGGRLDVWTRALMKPLDERYYTLTFDAPNGNARLIDVADAPDEWWAESRAAVEELARKFVYAAASGDDATVAQFTSPGLDYRALLHGRHSAIVRQIHRVQQEDHPYFVVMQGMRLQVREKVYGNGQGLVPCSIRVTADRLGDQMKVVAWSFGECDAFNGAPDERSADPNLAVYTLERYQLQTSGALQATPPPSMP